MNKLTQFYGEMEAFVAAVSTELKNSQTPWTQFQLGAFTRATFPTYNVMVEGDVEGKGQVGYITGDNIRAAFSYGDRDPESEVWNGKVEWIDIELVELEVDEEAEHESTADLTGIIL